MYYRKLGRTGCLVSEIGFAAWPRPGRPAPDDSAALLMLRQALERGVNLVDLPGDAASGTGEAERMERLVGTAIAGRREQVLLATRVRTPVAPQQLGARTQASLERLRCDYLDLLQLECARAEDLQGGAVWDTLEPLLSTGIVRHLGVVAGSADVANAALEDGRVESLQIALNPADAELLPVLSRARSEGVGVIVRSPLFGGLFATPGDVDHRFVEGDPRRAWPEEQKRAALIVVERFCRIVAAADCTPAQAALGWALSHEEVASVLPITTAAAHLAENLDAAGLPLPGPRHLAAIQQARLTAVPV